MIHLKKGRRKEIVEALERNDMSLDSIGEAKTFTPNEEYVLFNFLTEIEGENIYKEIYSSHELHPNDNNTISISLFRGGVMGTNFLVYNEHRVEEADYLCWIAFVE